MSAVERALSSRAKDPDEIRRAVVRLALQAAAALELAREEGEPWEALGASGASLGRSIARAAAWMRHAGMRAIVAEERPLPSSAAITQRLAPEELSSLLSWVTEPAPGGRRPKALGVLYQELLLLRLRRLGGTSVCLRPGGVWISGRDVLREPAGVRAKWVQRTAGLPKSAVSRLAEPLARARTEDSVVRALAAVRTPGPPGMGGELVVEAGTLRRHAGAHYTPTALCQAVVERTLGPLTQGANPRAILELRLCDPAMGDGVFLEIAARYLAGKVARDGPKRQRALRSIVERCVFGVDADPIAADLSRWSLSRLATPKGSVPPDLSANLRCADALVGRSPSPQEGPVDPPPSCDAFDWPAAFPDAFRRNRAGFDACIGNPPWVAYVGRAAQPLPPELFDYYARTNPAFHGYRTLHGLFVRRGAELVRPGGRLGLVIPTSVADLDGYAPTRRAHDALCDVDRDLTDFGDGAFAGVFQPCMALTSTRRSSPRAGATGARWTLARTDLDTRGRGLLARLSALPPLDAGLFGERGFQTTKDDLSHLRRLQHARPPFTVPMHEGADVGELTLATPTLFLDPSKLTGRLRPEAEWRAVRVLIRQTARYPIATLSDGHAFRNSILAGFCDVRFTPHALCAYLNSSAVRWFHFVRHRDARQGMPQLKIGHLRSVPDLASGRARARLDELGRTLESKGLAARERRALDDVVFDALCLDDEERRMVTGWMRAHPLPKPRKRRPQSPA